MDTTERMRRQMQQQLNSNPKCREELERLHGQVWDTEELQEDFEVRGFAAPFVLVKSTRDGENGTLLFQHSPRYYFCYYGVEGA
jgi:hypothetical protein